MMSFLMISRKGYFSPLKLREFFLVLIGGGLFSIERFRDVPKSASSSITSSSQKEGWTQSLCTQVHLTRAQPFSCASFDFCMLEYFLLQSTAEFSLLNYFEKKILAY